jgi:hypothetical protein
VNYCSAIATLSSSCFGYGRALKRQYLANPDYPDSWPPVHAGEFFASGGVVAEGLEYSASIHRHYCH